MIPVYNSADFQAALTSLFPRGPAWNRTLQGLMPALRGALADAFAALHARILVFTEQESWPPTSVELLPDWEAEYGLPDPCTPASPTLEQRQAALAAREAAQGGQSPAYFMGVAAALGFTVMIVEYAPAECGVTTCGQPMNGSDWVYAWQVNAPSVTVTYAAAGHSVCGDPLSSFGNAVLQCVLNRIKPAHTVLIFAYG